MIEFKIYNRFSSKVQFTAKIDCTPNAVNSWKKGLAVQWALRNRFDLTGASLLGANLHRADLRDADLRYAYLYSADLSYADLSNVDLCHADLSSANLYGADLRGADLRYTSKMVPILAYAMV